jgi:DNA-binding transcriptional MerR regulator
MNRNHHLTISAFAEASLLSIKALRLYDELGILPPALIDPESGYRYYHPDQLGRARLIRQLRQLEMPLAIIRGVLEGSPAEAVAQVQAHWAGLQQQMQVARVLVPDVIASLKGENPMSAFHIEIKTTAAQPVLSKTKHIYVDGLDSFIQNSVTELKALAAQHHAMVSGSPFGIFHGQINDESNGPLQVCLPLQAAVPGSDELPAGKLACVTVKGSECDFPNILKAYDAVADWITRHGYQMAGSPREVWHAMERGSEHMSIEWPFND